MKDIVTKIYESFKLSLDDHLDSIIRLAKVNINEPFFFMCRIPKKKEFHIYSCQGREQLKTYFEKTQKEPLEFGRFQAIRQTKEELIKITKLWTFKKDHYKTIEEN
jgi:hypothetical protein